MSDRIEKLEHIFLQSIRFQRRGGLRRLWKMQAFLRHALGSHLRRKKLRKTGILAPVAITLSPTMRCNLSCIGCYSQDYPQDDELTLEHIEKILDEAETLGTFLFIITGGEPLLKEGILELFKGHKKLLFLMITNGTLMTGESAKAIAQAGNIIPVVSIEGSKGQTDSRRGSGIYDKVEQAMKCLETVGALFGFSAMVTRETFSVLSSDDFIQKMIGRGCALGFYTEYIPVGSGANWDMVLQDNEREYFRKRLIEIRREKPIIVAHLPDDEYTPDGKCMGIMEGCFHINSQGYVEPCPFAHFSSENVREKSLLEICRSEFLSQIRSSEAVNRHGRIGCALTQNLDILQEIASKTGAKPTDCSYVGLNISSDVKLNKAGKI